MFNKTNLSNALYTKDGDNDHLYRIIMSDRIPFLRKLDQKFFPKWEVVDDIISEKYETLKIEKLDYDIRIFELTSKQQHETLLFMVDLIINGINNNISIFDIHEGNILYHHRPYFVDLNAFKKLDEESANYQYVMMVYLYLRYIKNINIQCHENCNYSMLKEGRPWVSKLYELDTRSIECWKEFRKKIKLSKPKPPKSTLWSDNYAMKKQVDNPKLSTSIDMLKNTSGTMIDIGTNKGYFAFMMHDKYSSVLGVDVDEKCIDIADDRCKFENVTFARLGIEDYYNPQRDAGIPRIERHKSDVLVALAVTHHFRSLGFNAEKVANAFCDLANEWILIEDIEEVGKYHKVFKDRGFRCVEKRDSHPSARKLTLWHKSKSS